MKWKRNPPNSIQESNYALSIDLNELNLTTEIIHQLDQDGQSISRITNFIFPELKEIDSAKDSFFPAVRHQILYRLAVASGEQNQGTTGAGPHHQPSSVMSMSETWSILADSVHGHL